MTDREERDFPYKNVMSNADYEQAEEVALNAFMQEATEVTSTPDDSNITPVKKRGRGRPRKHPEGHQIERAGFAIPKSLMDDFDRHKAEYERKLFCGADIKLTRPQFIVALLAKWDLDS